MPAVDLNADVGEGYDADDALMRIVTSANVACGFHAGDAGSMRLTCAVAVRSGVAIGAQVSYRDRAGFGRRPMDVDRQVLVADVVEQVHALRRAAATAGGVVSYLKPHGALYNRVVDDEDQAAGVAEAAAAETLPVLGLPGSRLLALAARLGAVVRREFFADRGYDRSGRLVPRGQPDALVTDAEEVERRVRRILTDRVVRSIDGADVPVVADSICVHGDSPDAVALATAARRGITAAGWEAASGWDVGPSSRQVRAP
jgi:UPF0271 protein